MATVTDPVCGTRLDSSQAVAQAVSDGVASSFCSEACRQTVLEDPAAFVRTDDREDAGRGRPGQDRRGGDPLRAAPLPAP